MRSIVSPQKVWLLTHCIKGTGDGPVRQFGRLRKTWITFLLALLASSPLSAVASLLDLVKKDRCGTALLRVEDTDSNGTWDDVDEFTHAGLTPRLLDSLTLAARRFNGIQWETSHRPLWTTWKIYLTTLSPEGIARIKAVRRAAIVNAFDYLNRKIYEERAEGPFDILNVPQQIGIRAKMRRAIDPRDFWLSHLSDWIRNPHETKEYRIYFDGDPNPKVVGVFHGNAKGVGGDALESIRNIIGNGEKVGKAAVRLQIAHTHPTEAFIFYYSNGEATLPNYGEISRGDIAHAQYYKSLFPTLQVEITAIIGIRPENMFTLTYTAADPVSVAPVANQSD